LKRALTDLHVNNYLTISCLSIYQASKMSDSLVDSLKQQVQLLEVRVRDLESKALSKPLPRSNSLGDNLRMILIGPPGAGKVATIDGSLIIG